MAKALVLLTHMQRNHCANAESIRLPLEVLGVPQRRTLKRDAALPLFCNWRQVAGKNVYCHNPVGSEKCRFNVEGLNACLLFWRSKT